MYIYNVDRTLGGDLSGKLIIDAQLTATSPIHFPGKRLPFPK